MMEAGISAKSAQSSRSKPVNTRGALANIRRCFVDIGAAAKYFLRPRHPGPAEGHSHDAAVEAAATAPLAADVNVNMEPEINAVAHSMPDQQEIERRRNLVRIFFNDFWSGASNKPVAFVERLDEAEDYLNERLAANGEVWRVDAETRVMLGLPPRSNSSVSANIDRHTSGK
jgi:hypothetical protein